MKIFNVENGVKKVYVQLNDIMMMMHFGSAIPSEVMEKHFMEMFIVDDSNRYEFSEFTDPHTVEFFEQCDWIVDFKEYKDLTEDEIKAKGQEIAEKMYERHQILAKALMALGVDEETAYEDSCKIEHHISEQSFKKIKEYLDKQQ